MIAASKSYLVSVLRDELFLLGTLGGEVGVLLVLEFLHRVADVLGEYFGGLDDACIKDNFSTVYQVPPPWHPRQWGREGIDLCCLCCAVLCGVSCWRR